ncbi:HAD family hydrolase [Phocaeicola sp.]
MKKLVIFDLDGTLLNTIADLAAATNQALQHYGYPTHDTEAYRFFVGNGINKLFERALPEGERTKENVLKIRSRFVPYYDEHNADLSCPYPGIPELLSVLQQEEIMLAVASNKYQAATQKLITHYFPAINFVEVLGQREGIPAKPDPSIVHDIIAKAGVKKEEVLYVGDSNVDMQTAHNAGVTAVGVAWGFRPRMELEALHPAYIIEKAAELLSLLY